MSCTYIILESATGLVLVVFGIIYSNSKDWRRSRLLMSKGTKHEKNMFLKELDTFLWSPAADSFLAHFRNCTFSS